MTVVGADPAAVVATARCFTAAAASLSDHRRALDALYASTPWAGTDARRHRDVWAGSSRRLVAVAGFLESLGQELQRQATEQSLASAPADGPLPAALWLSGGLGDGLTDGRRIASARPRQPAATPVDVTGRDRSTFDAPADGRGAVVAAMGGLADPERIRRDEIEIRALENGRFIVVLPGVTDLSAGVGDFVDRVRSSPLGVPGATGDLIGGWADNDEPTVRKMRHAFEAALRDDTTTNEYSVATLAALRRAGVPSGAEVMLVGHSFGAYTAVDLAADPAVNAAFGAASDGYVLDITHVVAAGAETDWRFQELPRATAALVVNNRLDAVYRAEDLLHRGGLPEHDGQVEVEFWGGWSGYGHDERHYLDHLRTTRRREVVGWLEGAGRRYASPGTRVSVSVPDPAT